MASFSFARLNPRRWLTWGLVLGAGVLLIWILLSFLVRFPIDEDKVYPALRTSASGSNPLVLGHAKSSDPNNSLSVFIMFNPDGPKHLFLSPAGFKPETIEHLGDMELVEASLDEFPHTRRRLVHAFEEGRAEFIGDDEFWLISHDPFFLTRQTLRMAYRRGAEVITGSPPYP